MLLSMEEFRAFQPKKPTYALFGWPLGHTMSPELHAQLFEASGQNAAYIGVAVPPDDLAEAFDLAKAKLRGINCTIPHKKAVIELLERGSKGLLGEFCEIDTGHVSSCGELTTCQKCKRSPREGLGRPRAGKTDASARWGEVGRGGSYWGSSISAFDGMRK